MNHQFPVGVLRSEAFVIVIVAVDHNIGTGMVQDVPKGFYLWISAVCHSRTKQRTMKVGKSTPGWVISKIVL